MITKCAFLDENYVIVYISEGTINTMEFNPPINDINYSHILISCESREGICEVGKMWNSELNKFE